jgi:hypothetical protein
MKTPPITKSSPTRWQRSRFEAPRVRVKREVRCHPPNLKNGWRLAFFFPISLTLATSHLDLSRFAGAIK